ncbi:hypothetical protein GCM10022216_14540 [Sphingobacterium kyonggiense]|uniref:Uncharacterized protein n=1 Tax=Sphingobacterium kyonggiense TaxID=714075 RepID=A0ABP7YL94_9SPHI
MHSIEIPSIEQSILIPSEWDDCSNEQAEFILKHAMRLISGELDMEVFQSIIFKYFTGIKTGISYIIRQKLGLNKSINERIFALSSELCSWVFEKNEIGNYQLSFETVNNFFPVLLSKYHGPKALLSDLSFSEFNDALSLLNLYYDQKDDFEESENTLNQFLSIIYRPLDNQGIRIAYNPNSINSDIFKSELTWRKQLIAVWFSYCIKCLQSQDLVIDGLEVNFKALFPEASNSNTGKNKIHLGWKGVLMDIAESGVFGDAKGTGATSLYDILIFLLKKQQEQPKQP